MTDNSDNPTPHENPPIWKSRYNHPTQWDQFFQPLSMPGMFFRSAGRRGDANLLDFMGRKYSYAEIATGVTRVAKGLQDLGVEKGDRIGLFLPNVPHYVSAYYGAMAIGATVVNFSPLYTVEELNHQVEDSGTKILFTLSASAVFPTAYQVLQQSSLERLVVGSVAGALPKGKALFYRLFRRKENTPQPDDDRITPFADLINNDGNYKAANIRPEKDIALLQYTGGTTGTPKGAMLSHQNLTANARQINGIDPYIDEADRLMGVLPFFHVFANSAVLNRTVERGGEIIMLPRFDAKQTLKAITRNQITAMPGVPTMYQALLDHPDIDKTNFSSLKVCVSGGAPLPQELKKKFEAKTGAKLVEGYGLTESSGVVSANPYEGLNKPGTIGQPVAATLVKLVDKEDPTKQVPDGEPGELIFSGPQVMQGYWNMPEADEEVFVDGFLRTGDVAQIDEDGYIKIVDRIKDMIAVGGFKVFPSQVEEVLYKHEAVKEALVIGVPDEYRGESPKAYVALEAGASATGEDLKNWLNPQLGKHERVIDVVVRESLPKTMIGKLDRKALRAEELK
ncbi:long-chain-fatty-acid--CoA ligase [Parasphingorhabdus halotolerans]|uniref:Long-chain fatty acid--CoA ligase n=1 Tax=Parasphingorhabdus halotolerans TaxID=2725558 RepID=A0A6H2DRB0_9SPHN|nr:long-chain fatty acid--CoA ligase [Parasphingorhabdus halotolerans]QJB70485.1 long-chain fatty acid--CoA ligase [Parasphingorhabdus halotolerans]